MASGQSSFNSADQDEGEEESTDKSDLLKVDESKPNSQRKGKVSFAMNDLLESLQDHAIMDTKDAHLSDISQTSTVTKQDQLDMNGNMSICTNLYKRLIKAFTIFLLPDN